MEAPNDNCKHLSRSLGEISDQNATIRSDKYNNKYICEHCHDTFKDLDFIRHKNICQIYSSFYKKTILKTGRCFYQCLICAHETKSKTKNTCHIGEARRTMQKHLKTKHSEEIKKKLDFQKQNCNDVEIANQNDMIRFDSTNQQTCEYCHETFKGKVSDFSRHKKICQIYSRFYKKVVINKSGKFYYQCVICAYETKLKTVTQRGARKARERRALSSMARGTMRVHLRNKHPEKINKKLDFHKQNCKDTDSNENFENWEDMETEFGAESRVHVDRNENDINNISNNCPNLENRTNLQPIIKLTPIKLPKRMLAKNVRIEETHDQENTNPTNLPNSETQNQIKAEINEQSAEIIQKNDSSESEVKFCLEASKFIMNQTCLICDCEFESMAVVLNHIEKLHLSIILKPTVNSNHEKIGNMKEEDFKIDIEENFIENSWESNFTKSQGQLETIKAENIDYTSAAATTEPTGAGVNTFSAILKTPTKEVSISESDLTNENTNIGKKKHFLLLIP